jgi:hypothetical protein
MSAPASGITSLRQNQHRQVGHRACQLGANAPDSTSDLHTCRAAPRGDDAGRSVRTCPATTSA